jgi:hypothetical protein
MGWKTATTRRQRHLRLYVLYILRERHHRARNYTWTFDEDAGHTVRADRKWQHVRGPKWQPLTVTARTYNATPSPAIHPAGTVLNQGEIGPRRPPHIRFKFPRVWGVAPSWTHQQAAVISYHVKRVQTRNKRPRDARNTAFNRRVTGCNWFFFLNGYYPADDVLDRHPRFEDINPQNPPPTRVWPVPLGYQ